MDIALEYQEEMSDTHAEQAVVEGVTHKCAWCGEPAASKCSRCRHVWLCSKACMKKIHKTHRHICVRTTQLITKPNVSPLFGVGTLSGSLLIESCGASTASTRSGGR